MIAVTEFDDFGRVLDGPNRQGANRAIGGKVRGFESVTTCTYFAA